MAKHALLSASGAHRWLLCTPSAQLEQKFPASTSAYAEEGTVAHALAELTTRYFLGELDEVSYENQIKSEFEPNSYGVTASGVVVEAGRTIAVDSSVIPLGSEIVIDGHTYVAEDTGSAIKGNRIDIYFDTHQEALNFGVQYADIYIIKN